MMLNGDASDRVEIVVVSNREPCVHDFSGSGEIVARRPASGLVSALEPVVQRYGGRWIAHGSGSADRTVSDASGHITITSSTGSYVLRRVWMTRSEERGYYYGFANQGLWPLCHRAFAAPLFRRSDWAAYQAVNARFARAIASEVKSRRPLVFVQDYHFALLPQLLREHSLRL